MQYKIDSALKKNELILTLPRFFVHLLGEQSSAANLKLIHFSSKRSRFILSLL